MGSEQAVSSHATNVEQELRDSIRGDLLIDEVARGIYATDASHYQVMPQCVVLPTDSDDAVAAAKIAASHGMSITARGGGTSLSGQTTWDGMVLDCSRYMDRVLEVNATERWVRVQPGVVRDRLNAHVAEHGLHFAPDPATGSRATVGGMVGNNSSGTHSIVFGKTIDHVLETKVGLADGTVLECRDLSSEEWSAAERSGGRIGEIYRGVREIIAANAEEIERRFPKVMRRVGGYNLDAFVEAGKPNASGNLADLIVGSEGTLGVLLEAKLRLEPLPKATALCVVHFDDLYEALSAVPGMLEHNPVAVELLDRLVAREAKRNPTTAVHANIVEGDPACLLIVELAGDESSDVQRRLEAFIDDMRRRNWGYAWPVCTTAESQASVWTMRKLGLGLIGNLPGKKGQACIEDACVPVEHLADYIRQVDQICQRHDTDLTIYAHASVGVLHARPLLDLHDPKDVQRMLRISEDVFALVQEYGGSWSGEHGDGLLRGQFVEPFFGPQVYEAFRQVKQLFDPQGVMNPGKIIDAAPMTENLRFGSKYKQVDIPTQYHYRDHGGLQLAVEQCSGVGACRKLGEGTMCPSYMATRDERHTTRGRANALRMAMTGQLPNEDLTGDGVAEVLELCLACKACKSECPTAVDVARFKSEVLQMRYDKFGVPQAVRRMVDFPKLLASMPLPLIRAGHWLQGKLGFEDFVKRTLGFDSRRPLPRPAAKSLTNWWAEHLASNHREVAPNGTVLFFVDTFTNYLEPHIGRAAILFLEACGYEVHPADVGCCQRMAISKGMLRDAKSAGLETLTALDGIHPEAKIVAVEPSCGSALLDDLPDLIDDVELGQRIAGRVRLLDQFVAEEMDNGTISGNIRSTAERVIVHAHCHQKAVFGTTALGKILDHVAGLEWQLIDAGCCGMAGSFGYEHYDVSEQVGEDRLFPAVRSRAPGTEVIATGTSCRQQLHDFLGVEARHWVELLTV